MPASFTLKSKDPKKLLLYLGCRVRARRKLLGLSATVTAEASGMSRITLYRIEKGESSVAIGAYLAAIFALGLRLELIDGKKRINSTIAKLPEKIRLTDYPQLKRLAWQLKESVELTPKEALELYERNWRHIDRKALKPAELELIEKLLTAFDRERLLV